MDSLYREVHGLSTSPLKKAIDGRLAAFKVSQQKGNTHWFHELCYCMLAANTSAEMASRIQHQLPYKDIVSCATEEELAQKLHFLHSRFFNIKGKFIFGALKHKKIKDILLK